MHLPTWSVCPREFFLGVDEKSSVFSRFLLGGHDPARRRSFRASAFHDCAFAYLPNVVLVYCGARVPTNGLGLDLKFYNFLDFERMYPGEYVSKSTSTYARS